jgi:hypothetical protein
VKLEQRSFRIHEKLDVEDVAIELDKAFVDGPVDGLSPIRIPSLAEGLDEIQPPATRYAGAET